VSSISNLQPHFDQHVEAWQQYTQSAGGRLRHQVILHHLLANIPSSPLKILDVGGGTGEQAADLARLGHDVTLLDFSPPMLEAAHQHCAGLAVTYACAQVSQVDTLFSPQSFDVVLCHSLLEFVQDPMPILQVLTNVLRKRGLISIVVGNRHHAPLRAALVQGDYRGARLGLDGDGSETDLFGLPRRTFYPEAIHQMLEARGLRLVGEYGVRVFSDLMGNGFDVGEDLLALELSASPRMPYRHLARFIQFVGVKN
jgi:S-adenosylmethionine-dependent methyltransferase